MGARDNLGVSLVLLSSYVIVQALTKLFFRESAPEILREYFEKIGGRETIGAKRKRGRPSETTGTDSSEKLPMAKKQKVESKPVIEKVQIIRNEGEDPGANSTKEDKNSAGEGDDEEIIPRMPAPKKGRGRYQKSEALETSQEGNGTSNSVPRIVSAKAEPSLLAKPSKSKKKEPMSKAEQEEKIDQLKRSKEQFARQLATSDSENAPAGPIVSSSSNEITKKGPGRPQESKAFEASQEGIDTVKNAPGIAMAQAEPPRLSQASKPKNNESISKIKQENKMEILDGLKTQSDSQGFTPINDPDERTVAHSSNDVAKKGRCRPPKAQDQLAPLDDETTPGRDTTKKGPGRSPQSSSQMSSQKQPIPLEHGSAKKSPGRPPKSKEPNAAQAAESLAGNVVKNGPGCPLKDSASTPSLGTKISLKDTSARRGPGRPSKIKQPQSIKKDSEEDQDDLNLQPSVD